MKFRSDNKIRYGQDFRQHVGIPSGVDFDVEHFGNKYSEMYVLTAPGYGDTSDSESYGAGSLHVWGLTERQRKRFEDAIAEQEKETPSRG